MQDSIPEYAIGIRAFYHGRERDGFGLPRCAATALHGMVEGAWELTTIEPGVPVPAGWRVAGQGASGIVIKRTHWERITP